MSNQLPCPEWVEQLVRKSKEPSFSGAVDAHIQTCAACADAVADYRFLIAGIRGLPKPTVKPLPRLFRSEENVDGEELGDLESPIPLSLERRTSTLKASKDTFERFVSLLIVASLLFAWVLLLHRSTTIVGSVPAAHPTLIVASPSNLYRVVGPPTISADFINKVLDSYHSPAARKGQALYNLGIQYDIDPAFALAIFMHESTFGTAGEARVNLSLGNLGCLPNIKCRASHASFDTWEDGFKAWYELIRNLYVAQWELTTVDQIIPKYAPQADHNDEKAYIAAVKHAIDTWHAGILKP